MLVDLDKDIEIKNYYIVGSSMVGSPLSGYSFVCPFKGNFIVKNKDNRYGYVDCDGNIIVDFSFHIEMAIKQYIERNIPKEYSETMPNNEQKVTELTKGHITEVKVTTYENFIIRHYKDHFVIETRNNNSSTHSTYEEKGEVCNVFDNYIFFREDIEHLKGIIKVEGESFKKLNLSRLIHYAEKENIQVKKMSDKLYLIINNAYVYCLTTEDPVMFKSHINVVNEKIIAVREAYNKVDVYNTETQTTTKVKYNVIGEKNINFEISCLGPKKSKSKKFTITLDKNIDLSNEENIVIGDNRIAIYSEDSDKTGTWRVFDFNGKEIESIIYKEEEYPFGQNPCSGQIVGYKSVIKWLGITKTVEAKELSSLDRKIKAVISSIQSEAKRRIDRIAKRRKKLNNKNIG